MPSLTADTALTMFLVTLREEFDPESILDGPVIVEDENGRLVISAADPDASAKLLAHPAVATVERIGEAALIMI